MKVINRIIIAVFIFLLCKPNCYGYDDENVHPAINENAANQSTVDTVLKQLGYIDGLKQGFKKSEGITKEALGWIKKGGKDEDDAPRFIDHFHDPLQFWLSAGLFHTHSSSIIWTQNAAQQYSWQEARTAFYNALTTGSESDFAETFLALGHLMHLVADAAVPAHTRNDAHPFNPNELPWSIIPDWLWPSSVLIDPYEEWAKNNYDDPTQITYIGAPVDLAIFNNYVYSDYAPIPISAIWDQNRYQGPNPDPNITKDVDPVLQNIGLAEYTNANFFSFDTIFKDYPHPSYDETDVLQIDWLHPILVDAEDDQIDSRIYIHGWAGGTVDIRLASVSYISYNCLQAGYNQFGAPILDEEVHKDYATMLIPRAVGYSAALLDYFFRGDIDMVQDPNSYGYVITNNSNEEMNGTFALYYDDNKGDRHLVDGAEWELTIGPKVGDTPGESMSVYFTPPTFPAPEHPGQYMLVFHGQMGNEEGAVAAAKVASSPIIVIKLTGTWNNVNRFQITPDDLAYYILWDVMKNALFTVHKAGGGNWEYPISESDYNTGFHDDLMNMLGIEVEHVNIAPLLERTYSATDPSATEVESPFNSSYFSMTILSPINYRYIRPEGAEIWASRQVWRDGSNYWADYLSDVSQSDIDTNNYSEALVNAYGGTDSYMQTQSINDVYTYESHYDPGEQGTVTHRTRIFTATTETTTDTPDGGFRMCRDSGWPQNYFSIVTGIPYSVLGESHYHDDSFLAVLNNSGAPLFNFSVGLNWYGTSSYDERFDSIFIKRIYDIPDGSMNWWYSDNRTWDNTINNEYTGSGTFTTALGGTGEISYSSLETGHISTLSAILDIQIPIGTPIPDSDLERTGTYPPEWYANYSLSNRELHYLYRPTTMASGFDVTNNFVVVILAEAIATGSKGGSLVAPDPPVPYYNYWVNRWVFNFDGPTESDIIYDVNAVDYNVKAICSQVEDANTQNPWALPDNAGLETELTAMITSFLNAAGYPSDHFGAQVAPDADYWNLNFTVNKLTWGF